MLLNRALSKAKRTDEEKVGLNIKVPIGLKNEFDELCKENGVSMTSMMLALIETVLDESKGHIQELDAEGLLNLHNQILKLEKEIDLYYTVETDAHGNDFHIPEAALHKTPESNLELENLRKLEFERNRLKFIFETYTEGKK